MRYFNCVLYIYYCSICYVFTVQWPVTVFISVFTCKICHSYTTLTGVCLDIIAMLKTNVFVHILIKLILVTCKFRMDK